MYFCQQHLHTKVCHYATLFDTSRRWRLCCYINIISIYNQYAIFLLCFTYNSEHNVVNTIVGEGQEFTRRDAKLIKQTQLKWDCQEQDKSTLILMMISCKMPQRKHNGSYSTDNNVWESYTKYDWKSFAIKSLKLFGFTIASD